MTITRRIIDLAEKSGGAFEKKDLVRVLCSDGSAASEGSVVVTLNRMQKKGYVIKSPDGGYLLGGAARAIYSYKPDAEVIAISRMLAGKFPFADFCAWKTSALVPFMRHIPSAELTLIDVEREVMEAAYSCVQNIDLPGPVLFNPSRRDCERYIGARPLAIVRPLVKEAPLATSEGCPVPTLEKMLVDAAADRELYYLRGSELYSIYESAMSAYDINESRLLRYASRRNRKPAVQKILKEIKSNDTPR